MTSMLLPFIARTTSPGFVDFWFELRDGRHRADDGGAAGHVALHRVHVERRLERNAAGVKRDALADKAEHILAGLVAAVFECDHFRRFVAADGDRKHGAHAEL